MNLHEVPDEFQSKIRLSIIAALYAGPMCFVELKRATHATDGNLGVHLRKLEEAGYVHITKSFSGRKPNTSASLSPKGREQFRSYVELLKDIVNEAYSEP